MTEDHTTHDKLRHCFYVGSQEHVQGLNRSVNTNNLKCKANTKDIENHIALGRFNGQYFD